MSVTFGSDWVYGILLILTNIGLLIVNYRISRLREDLLRVDALSRTHEWSVR